MVLPLMAMHDEYRSRARKHNITCETWSTRSLPTSPPQLLIVAIELGILEQLKIYIQTLARLSRLARIVVDEAHLLLKHQNFRPCVDLLQYFGQLAVSIILMTATLPRDLEQELFRKVGRQTYRVLRRKTDRPEIVHSMIPLEQNVNIEEVVAKKVLERVWALKEPERALVFCLSRSECDRMSILLGWKPYHADVSTENRSQYLKEWRLGGVKGLVCTSMLNCCLDYHAVRLIFHLGIPRDALDYSQATGRVSRDNSRGESIVFFDPKKCRAIKGPDPFGEGAIHQTLQDDTTCRRLRLALFLDGTAMPCAMLPSGQLCDVCTKQTGEASPLGITLFPAHLMPKLHPAGGMSDDSTSSTSLPPSSITQGASVSIRVSEPSEHNATNKQLGVTGRNFQLPGRRFLESKSPRLF
jgi:hypothetical protein